MLHLSPENRESNARFVTAGLEIASLIVGVGGIVKPAVTLGKNIVSKLIKNTVKPRGLGGNPFAGKTPPQIEKMFLKKGFEPIGPAPLDGKGAYINPQTKRSFHIDSGKHKIGASEAPHVDVNYTGPKSVRPDKRKYYGIISD